MALELPNLSLAMPALGGSAPGPSGNMPNLMSPMPNLLQRIAATGNPIAAQTAALSGQPRLEDELKATLPDDMKNGMDDDAYKALADQVKAIWERVPARPKDPSGIEIPKAVTPTGAVLKALAMGLMMRQRAQTEKQIGEAEKARRTAEAEAGMLERRANRIDKANDPITPAERARLDLEERRVRIAEDTFGMKKDKLAARAGDGGGGGNVESSSPPPTKSTWDNLSDLWTQTKSLIGIQGPPKTLQEQYEDRQKIAELNLEKNRRLLGEKYAQMKYGKELSAAAMSFKVASALLQAQKNSENRTELETTKESGRQKRQQVGISASDRRAQEGRDAAAERQKVGISAGIYNNSLDPNATPAQAVEKAGQIIDLSSGRTSAPVSAADTGLRMVELADKINARTATPEEIAEAKRLRGRK